MVVGEPGLLWSALRRVAETNKRADAKLAAKIAELLERPAPFSDPLTEQLNELVDLLEEPPSLHARTLAPALAALAPRSEELALVAARTAVIDGWHHEKFKEPDAALACFDAAIGLLGPQWSEEAQFVWGHAMRQRVRHTRDAMDALALLDELVRRSGDSGPVAERALEASAAWMRRAEKQGLHDAIIGVCTRALALEIQEPLAATWLLRIDLGCGLALAARTLERFDEALAACRAVLAMKPHVTTDNQRANFAWALAEGAYIATELVERADDALPFLAAIRAAIETPRNADERTELAYAIVTEARCAFAANDRARTTELLAELDRLTNGEDVHAESAAMLLRGDLAAAVGERDAAIAVWTELDALHASSKDEALRRHAQKAAQRIAAHSGVWIG